MREGSGGGCGKGDDEGGCVSGNSLSPPGDVVGLGRGVVDERGEESLEGRKDHDGPSHLGTSWLLPLRHLMAPPT